jgi:hypothetical protein
MPSSIPYDPSLVLANIVSSDALKQVERFSGLQVPVDATQEHLNTPSAAKRSPQMTNTELLDIGVMTDKVNKSIEMLDSKIGNGASN